MIYLIYGVLVALLLWAGILTWQWWLTVQEEPIAFERYRETGDLKKAVTRSSFRRAFLRSEGPRFGSYMLAATLAAGMLVPVILSVFNSVWNFFWYQSGQPLVFEVGDIVHGLVLAIFMVGALFALAYFAMRTYHERRPGKLRAEIKRLNEDAS